MYAMSPSARIAPDVVRDAIKVANDSPWELWAFPAAWSKTSLILLLIVGSEV